jgi:hypothetical protein
VPTPTDNSESIDEGSDFRRELTRRAIVALFTISNTAVLMSGCSDRQHTAPEVNPELARTSLRTVLDLWKKGDKQESAKDGSPSIVVQDLDWAAGLALTNYEIQGDGKFDDANLRVPVMLTLKQPNGKSLTRKASYVVGTSPAITVFREMP